MHRESGASWPRIRRGIEELATQTGISADCYLRDLVELARQVSYIGFASLSKASFAGRVYIPLDCSVSNSKIDLFVVIQSVLY